MAITGTCDHQLTLPNILYFRSPIYFSHVWLFIVNEMFFHCSLTLTYSLSLHTHNIYFSFFFTFTLTQSFNFLLAEKTLMAIRSSDVSAESVLQLEAELHFQLCLSIYCKMALIFAADRQALSSWRWSLYLLFQFVATDFQKSMIPVIVYFIIKVTSFF